MKKLLYLHGLRGRNFGEKIDYLNTMYDVIAPSIDYDNRSNCYSEMQALIEKEKIDEVMGSSLGGFLAYYLSINNNIKSTLLNPALAHSKDVSFWGIESNEINMPSMTLILGKNDDVVPCEDTMNFMSKSHNLTYSVIVDNHGHATPLEILKKYVN